MNSARAIAFAAGLVACSGLAAPPGDPIDWLQRIVTGARETTYTGTVVHSAGGLTVTSRVIHVFRDGNEIERIESLDGPRQEIVRVNDHIQCFHPDSKTIRTDKRVSARFFPSLLLAPPAVLAESYHLRLGGIERVAGKDCQWVILEPRDDLRFAHRLCAHLASGLPLRSAMLGPSPRRQVLEQYSFTDLRLGRDVPPAEVRGTYEPLAADWRRDHQADEEAKPAVTGWTVQSPPRGFRLVHELQRKFPGRPHAVSQLVYSDGLAALSVFVEPAASAAELRETLTQDGGLSIYTRPMGELRVTVLGEVPVSAVRQVGRGVVRAAVGSR